eukprot:1502259-Pyramimonas_sp.AAC.1
MSKSWCFFSLRLRCSAVLSLGAAPGAFDVVSKNFLSVLRRVGAASLDDPSSVGIQPVLCVRPGVGPRRGTGPFGVGALVPWNAAAAAATAGPLDRRLSAGCPAGRRCLLSP